MEEPDYNVTTPPDFQRFNLSDAQPPPTTSAKETAASSSNSPEATENAAAAVVVDKCPICLQATRPKRKAYASQCFHSFCYDCLLEWTKIRHNCPLCKRDLDRIVYEIKSRLEFKEHYVSVDPEGDGRRRTMTQPLEIIGYRPAAATFGYDFFASRSEHAGVEAARASSMLGDDDDDDKSGRNDAASFVVGSETAPVEFRSLVYLKDWYAYPTQAQANIQISQVDLDTTQQEEEEEDADESIEVEQTRSAASGAGPRPVFIQYRPVSRSRQVTPKWYKNNPASTHRLMQFLHRELKALDAIASPKYRLDHAARHALQSRILQLVRQAEMTSEAFYLEIGPHIRPSRIARHFMHELHAFALSTSHGLTDYDASVVYYTKPDYGALREAAPPPSSSEENGKPVVALPVNLNKYRLTERRAAQPAPPPQRPAFSFFQSMPFSGSANLRFGAGGTSSSAISSAGLVAGILRDLAAEEEEEEATAALSDSDQSSFCEEVPVSPKKSPEYIVVTSSASDDDDDESDWDSATTTAARHSSRSNSVLSADEATTKRLKTTSGDDDESRPRSSKDRHHKHRHHKHHRRHRKHKHKQRSRDVSADS